MEAPAREESLNCARGCSLCSGDRERGCRRDGDLLPEHPVSETGRHPERESSRGMGRVVARMRIESVAGQFGGWESLATTLGAFSAGLLPFSGNSFVFGVLTSRGNIPRREDEVFGKGRRAGRTPESLRGAGDTLGERGGAVGALGAFPATLLLFVEIHPFSVLSSPGENCQRGRDLRGAGAAGCERESSEYLGCA